MAWRVAQSLLVLRDQINAAYPNRNKASDGTIGDAAHAASVSDHNPDSYGIVRALDITHDPASGCDIDKLTDELADSRDPRISYLIANSMITGPEYNWVWTAYWGSDPHTNHFHLSVVSDGRADDASPWNISGGSNMSTQSDEIIVAWSQGNPTTPRGSVEPVKWRMRDEEWQKNVNAMLATLASAISALSARVDSIDVTPELDYVKLVSEMIKQFSAD